MKPTLIVLCLLFVVSESPLAQLKQYYCPPCNNSCDALVFDKPGKCPHCNMNLIDHKPKKKPSEIVIAFYLQDGVEVLDFAGPMEVFAYAGFKVFTVSKTKAPIRSQGILNIIPDYSIDDAPQANILAFFGGNSGAASNDPQVINWVKKQSPNVDYHFSVCTGAFILGRAGLLDGLTVTTFHESIENLRRSFPKATVLDNVRFVDNGKVITTAGISAGIDGALYLVTKLLDEKSARRIVEYMEYDKWKPGEGKIMEKAIK